MSSSIRFHIQEHVIPCQHIREYPHSTSTCQEDILHLAVKQYIPIDNINPRPGDVTIIGAHANGFPKTHKSGAYEEGPTTKKELYEPLWNDLLQESTQKKGFRIRGIWIADVTQQGDSGVLNEHLIGNDASWFDHSRDLLHMINHFRDQMARPIVGIGHSMGGTQLIHLSLLHPRLLTSLILLDPVIHFQYTPNNLGMIRSSAFRRDIWASKQEAQRYFRRHPFYQNWDERVLDLWLKHGLRPLPTAIYPSTTTTKTDPNAEESVTLKTTKHQEVFTFLRPLPPPHHHKTIQQGPDMSSDDDDPDSYRPEPNSTLHNLPLVRPGTLFIFGAKSPINLPEARDVLLERTGTAVGGSGGARRGRVRAIVLDKTGHLMPIDAVRECARAAARWLGSEIERWKREELEFERWRKKPLREKGMIGEASMRLIGGGGDGKEGRVKGKL